MPGRIFQKLLGKIDFYPTEKSNQRRCILCILPCFTFFFFSSVNFIFADEITIGTGNLENTHLPTRAWYKYSYTEQIYLQSEIATEGNIDSIFFEWNRNSTLSRTIRVYMGHTTKSIFSDKNNWVTSTNMTQVYSGSYSLTTNKGWHKIVLSTPFSYNNSDNLVIGFDDNTGVDGGSSDHFYGTNSGAYRSIYGQDLSSDINPSVPNPFNRDISTNRANIKIFTSPIGPYPPVFKKHPQSDTVALGASVSFTAAAAGDSVPTYQWQKDSVDIPFANDTIFSIPAVAFPDAGMYRAVAENQLGSAVSNEAMLIVYDSILISSHPQSDTVLAGDTVQFTVETFGQFGFSYQWQKLVGAVVSDISGAVSNTWTFPADTVDDSTFYNCIVACGPVRDTSDYAQLTVATVPVITSLFPTDTAVATGGKMSLYASATATPPPEYNWYVYHAPGADTFFVETGATLTLDDVTKSQSGYYFFTADNGYASTNSVAVFLNVIDPVTIVIDLPEKYQAINGGEVVLYPEITWEGSAVSYQWYQDDSLLSGEISGSLKIDTVDSALHDGTIYQCEIWNSYLGILIAREKTRTCTLSVGRYYNPFKLKAERIDIHNTTQVRIKLWSDVPVSNFPSTVSGSPWADSVWVLYKSNGFATTVSEAQVAMYSTAMIAGVAPDTIIDTLTTGALPALHDSSFWFNYSVLWHDPSLQIDTLLQPLTDANKVFMVDTIPPPNPLVVHGEYIMRTDSARIIIDSLSKLNSVMDSLVVLECSRYSTFIPLFHDTVLSVNLLLPGGDRDTVIVDSIGTLPIELDTIFCRWYVIGTNGAPGTKLDTSFTIGWPRPVYTGTLSADSTNFGGEIQISWDKPDSAVDAIRIWWDNDTIPLDYTFQLPVSQSKDLDTAILLDTVKNLDNDRWYSLGLQVFRNDMWSRVTTNSRTWAKTALGDTVMIPNFVSVDSSWFNDTTNSIVIQWHIDTLPDSVDNSFQMGYMVSLDSVSVVDTNQFVPDWQTVTAKENVTLIPLFPAITFDTSYVVGLWLRRYTALTGPGKKSPPTDSSFVRVNIPSFTWQFITFFSDTVKTVYAANKKIILKEVSHFTTFDTLWSFKPPVIPDGFAQLGGVYFNFGNKNLNTPPFLVGMSYNSLPAGVTEDELGLYQYIDGQLHVMYGSYVENGAVWDTVLHSDLAYPFLVLADTAKPVVTLSPFSDTITTGADVPTLFDVKDNIANVRWHFTYGPGHENYMFSDKDTLQTSTTLTSVGTLIPDKNNVIHESYGVRALLITSDAIHTDTINVSRQVRTLQTGIVSIISHRWVPLNVTADVDDPGLAQVFERSVSEAERPWEYDSSKYRLYRWYDRDSSGTNSWVEYPDVEETVFDFVPGRLIWCKTAEDLRINFGPGVTPSLKEPYEIELKPQNWTDLSSPYQFPIMLRDILEATGIAESESLEVYYWQREAGAYVAVDKFIASLDTITKEYDTVYAHQRHDGYTVYNHGLTSITLKIPPISLPLSQYSHKGTRKTEKKPPKDAWNISFMWKNRSEGKEASFRRIRCGYRKSETKKNRFGFLPPTMSSVSVGIVDSRNNQLRGWGLQPDLKGGGISFEIRFTNNGNKKARLEYYCDNLDVLPERFSAQLLNPKTHKYVECSFDNPARIKVGSNSSAARILVIGTKEYLEQMIVAYMPMKLVKAYPNPFRGRINIRYRLPLGIKEVRFALYNLRGQQLWKRSVRKNLTPGGHVYLFNGRTEIDNGILPSGIYIMRMTAKNKSGKRVYGGRKRLICIK